jgi:hypothetical protein
MKSKHQEIADAWVECKNAWTERDEAVESLAVVTAERDALAEQLAALQKRVADAPECDIKYPAVTMLMRVADGYYALVRLEDGE